MCHAFRVRKGKNDWSQSLRTSSSTKVRCQVVRWYSTISQSDRMLSIFNVRKLDHVARSFPSIAQVTQSLQKLSVFAVFSRDEESSGTGLRTTCETIVNIRSLALNNGKFQSWNTHWFPKCVEQLDYGNGECEQRRQAFELRKHRFCQSLRTVTIMIRHHLSMINDLMSCEVVKHLLFDLYGDQVQSNVRLLHVGKLREWATLLSRDYCYASQSQRCTCAQDSIVGVGFAIDLYTNPIKPGMFAILHFEVW